MKLILNKSQLRDNAAQLMRAAGYNFLRGVAGEEMSFSRALAANGYPRFHLYLTEDQEKIYLNLHLDQKRPSYEGVSAHSGEYDGELVAKELARIKALS